jgi:hypothetical protein
MKTEGDRIDQKLNDHSGTACLLDSSPHAPTDDTLWFCIGFVERSPHNKNGFREYPIILRAT